MSYALILTLFLQYPRDCKMIIWGILSLVLANHNGLFVKAEETDRTATFDQRQSGHYNIHISIQDVAIFDLEGNDFTDVSLYD